MWITKLSFCFLASLILINANCSAVDSSIFSSKVDELLETLLKRKEMQTHLDSLPYTSQTLNGEQLLNSLAGSLENTFQKIVLVVNGLKDKASKEYGKNSNFLQCCNFSSAFSKYDARFEAEVATDSACEQIAAMPEVSLKKLSSTFVDTCADNLKILPLLKRQYFGSVQGVTTVYPAKKLDSLCDSYDNRFRQWYVQASVPKPKNVVIVIDKSGSMLGKHDGVTLMDLAKNASLTVLDTLNPFDKIAALSFDYYPALITVQEESNACFEHFLAQSTPKNKKVIADFITNLKPSGATRYGEALNIAFDYLQKQNDTNVDNVILFLSDGTPADKEIDILNTLKQRNAEMNNSTVVMTFGIGNFKFSVLEKMAKASVETSSHTNNTEGIFTAVTDPSKLKTQMGSYYQYLSSRNEHLSELAWTVPYVNNQKLGQMITASLPVYVASDLIGVAAVDVTLEELFADSTYFKPNELSYSFIIDKKGLLLNHPLLPYTYSETLYVSATAYERDPEFVSVFESMKRGESGSKTFSSTRILPGGDSKKYGVTQLKVPSTYHWKQIPSTKFSLCVVIADGSVQSSLNLQTSLPSEGFLYDRLDLVTPKNPCANIKGYASAEQTSVSLAPRAFTDPEYFLTKTFTKTDVEAIVKYMEGSGSNTENLKDQVKPEVVATYKVEELWSKDFDLPEHVIWRYIGTRNGVFRSFPGSQWPLNFDPTLRPWYEHSLANKNSNVIIPAYREANSGAVIVTLSRVLFQGKSSGVHNPLTDQVVGVMGVDMLLSFVHNLLHDIYRECKQSSVSKCYLIDKAGFVIVADEYLVPNASLNQHLSNLAPDIAFSLIQNRILISINCSNIEGGLIERTFMISSSQSTFYGVTSGNVCYSFELTSIENTNTYLIMQKSQTACSSIESLCYCDKLVHRCNDSSNQIKCECPCSVVNENYLPCQNLYQFSSNSPLPCAPDYVVSDFVTKIDIEIDSLPSCYELAKNISMENNISLEKTTTFPNLNSTSQLKSNATSATLRGTQSQQFNTTVQYDDTAAMQIAAPLEGEIRAIDLQEFALPDATESTMEHLIDEITNVRTYIIVALVIAAGILATVYKNAIFSSTTTKQKSPHKDETTNSEHNSSATDNFSSVRSSTSSDSSSAFSTPGTSPAPSEASLPHHSPPSSPPSPSFFDSFVSSVPFYPS